MNNAQINTLQLFEGPYKFDNIQTELNITADFIFYKLAKQYEYRETNKDLWAELNLNGVKSRYVLDYKNFGLVKKQTKVTSEGKIRNTTTRIFCGI
jgi:hypothetical protein